MAGRLLLGGAVGALAPGCAGEPGDPVVEAHRGGAAYWPENSLAALEGAVEMGYSAVEFDLFLTADRVPVLHHDPRLDPERCTTADGAPIGEEVWIALLTADELRSDYLCGGLPDPAFPDRLVEAAPVPTFEEAMEVLAGAPEMRVHLDVKYEPGMSHAPEVVAAEVLERWWARGLDNPVYASADTVEEVAALEERAAREGRALTTVLSWPRFPFGTSDVAMALAHEAAADLGFEDALAAAREAGADGLALPWQLVRRADVERAADAGLHVVLWTVDDPALREALARWPVDAIVTNAPEPAP